MYFVLFLGDSNCVVRGRQLRSGAQLSRESWMRRDLGKNLPGTLSKRLADVQTSFVKTCQVKFSAYCLFCSPSNRTLLVSKIRICLMFNKYTIYPALLRNHYVSASLVSAKIISLSMPLHCNLFFLLTFYSADSRKRPVRYYYSRHTRGR